MSPRFALLLMCLSAGLMGADAALVLGEGVPPPTGRAIASAPGCAAPAAQARAQALWVDWDRYRSWVVVAPGVGTVRAAWIATYTPQGEPVVAYRARASIDAQGELHLDARRSAIVGPKRNSWWPDSFAIAPDGSVRVQDEQSDAKVNPGRVLRSADGEYPEILALVRALVDEGL